MKPHNPTKYHFSTLLLLLSAQLLFSQITYTLHRQEDPTADQLDAYSRIQIAMDSAAGYYNSYTSIRKSLNIYYNTDVSTADGNFNGTIRFGASRSYMVPATTMHEIAHTVGIGTTTEYKNLIQNSKFTGVHATAMLRQISGDRAATLSGDAQHFWPHGLNYASEARTEADLINHCKMVDAIYKDLFQEEFYKICRLSSKLDGRCMSASGGALGMGSCSDSSSLVRMIALGGGSVFRLEFGNKVLDIPGESRNAGVAASLWDWNGGAHQRAAFEFSSSQENEARIRMSHSGLYLRVEGDRVIQDVGTARVESQYWLLTEPQTVPVTPAEHPKKQFVLNAIRGGVAIAYSSELGASPVLTIADLHGKVVRTGRVYSGTIRNSTRLASGVYMVRLKGNGRILESRVVVP